MPPTITLLTPTGALTYGLNQVGSGQLLVRRTGGLASLHRDGAERIADQYGFARIPLVHGDRDRQYG